MIRTELVDADGGARVAIVRLARPEKKNALTLVMLSELVRAIEGSGSRVGVRAMVLAGEGDAFCSGFDLSLCRDDTAMLGGLLTQLSRAVRAMRRLPMPVVCAAHGAAIAGGCALLGGTDFVVTNSLAKLGYPVVRLGISPAVTAPFLGQSLGAGRMRERLLGGSLVDGREALRIGLVHECVDEAGEVGARALDIANGLCGKPPGAMAATKRWMNEIDGSLDVARADAALAASVALVGSSEERARLAELWKA